MLPETFPNILIRDPHSGFFGQSLCVAITIFDLHSNPTRGGEFTDDLPFDPIEIFQASIADEIRQDPVKFTRRAPCAFSFCLSHKITPSRLLQNPGTFRKNVRSHHWDL